MPCRRFIVSGRVQGVWFRASTRDQANLLGLGGHAINLPDGRVEVIACGTDEALDRLVGWLRQGPPLAVVEQVSSEVIDERSVSGFETG